MKVDLKCPIKSIGAPEPSLNDVPTPTVSHRGDPVTGLLDSPLPVVSIKGDPVINDLSTPSRRGL